MVYPALLQLMRTLRLPVVDWTDAPADLNGLVRFCERRNLVSARVPSHFNWPLPILFSFIDTCQQRQCVQNLFYLSGFICMHKKIGGRGDSNTRLPKVQTCTGVENTFVKSVTFDIAFFHGLDMRSLQIKLYSYKNNLAIDMTRHKAHLVYYFVPRNIPFHSIYGATTPSGPWPPS